METKGLGWKIFGLLVSIFLIGGGLSGEMVLRGTDSSEALIVVGFLFLIWDIYAIVTHKKQQAEQQEIGSEPLLDNLALQPAEQYANNLVQIEMNNYMDAPKASPLPPATQYGRESSPAQGKETVAYDSISPYFMLEHKIGSKYHRVGENQTITANRIEIGRDPDCEVRYDEFFETVSRRHAAIVREGNSWKLIPLSQTNSTLVNGHKIQKEWYLQHGDEIQCAINGPKLGFQIPALR